MGKPIGIAVFVLLLLPAAAARAATPADCAGFAAKDAAPFLGVPAAQVTRHVEKVSPTLWVCSYAAGKAAPGVAFSIEVSASARKAAEELERYRDNLATAGEVAPFKGKLPQGAYSDIVGVGDEGVWTDVNGTFTVRKGHLTVQVSMPKAKLEQLKLAKALLAKF
ncbi:MAG TPA: hypothetical protein PK042_05060 [Usitatibacteraceae bacterium]|nr:hypothetical protein [Usitatibacteraceae bacterium]